MAGLALLVNLLRLIYTDLKAANMMQTTGHIQLVPGACASDPVGRLPGQTVFKGTDQGSLLPLLTRDEVKEERAATKRAAAAKGKGAAAALAGQDAEVAEDVAATTLTHLAVESYGLPYTCLRQIPEPLFGEKNDVYSVRPHVHACMHGMACKRKGGGGRSSTRDRDMAR